MSMPMGDLNPSAKKPGPVPVVPAIEITGDGAASINNGIVLTGQTNQSGASTGTLTNAPAGTNPNFWLPVNINGVLRKIPCW